MIPPAFEYHAPGTVAETIGLLSQYNGEAKILAGGHSLLPLMKLRLAEPRALIDIQRIPNLAYVKEEGEFLKVGPVTRVNDLLGSPATAAYPILRDAAREIADPVVRNLGTVGGNLCHGDPGNDLPACWIALGGEMTVTGAKGSRTVPAASFYQDTFVTAVGPSEMLTEARVPKARPGQGSSYFKIEKRVGDFAIAGVATSLVLDGKGRIASAGLGLTGVGPTALAAGDAAQSLVGQSPDAAHVSHAAKLAAEAAKPSSDLRGPAEYKRAVVEALARRGIERAVARARGGK